MERPLLPRCWAICIHKFKDASVIKDSRLKRRFIAFPATVAVILGAFGTLAVTVP